MFSERKETHLPDTETAQNGVGLVTGINDAAGFTAVVVDDVAVGLVSSQREGIGFQHTVSSLAYRVLSEIGMHFALST